MFADKPNHAAERGVVAQLEVFDPLDIERRAHGREGLGLLDRIDAQVGLKVEVELEHVGGVAGLLGHDRQHLRHHRVGGLSSPRCGNALCHRRRCRGRGSWRGGQVGPVFADKPNHAAERGVVAQLEVFDPLDIERRAHGREGLGLLDRIDAQVGLKVEVELEHVGGVAGLLGHDRQHLRHHRVGGRGRRGGHCDGCRRGCRRGHGGHGRWRGRGGGLGRRVAVALGHAACHHTRRGARLSWRRGRHEVGQRRGRSSRRLWRDHIGGDGR